MAAIRIHGIVVIAAVISCVFVAHAYWLLPNHDSTTYIFEAQKLLAGGRFYDDIMETNPPLIVIMTEPGVLIGQATGLGLWVGFTAWVCVLIVISWLLAVPYLSWIYNDKPLVSTLLAIAYVVATALIPAYDFSQREHLTVVLLLPALLWFAAREAGRVSTPDLRCLVTLLLAALGLLIKPFFLLVAAILVLVRAVRHHNWRMLFGIETVIVATVSLLYALLVFNYFPGWLATAGLASQVYFAFQESWGKVLSQFLPSAGLELAVLLILLQITPMPPHQKIFLRQLAIAALGFLALAILQRKGWSYHVLPVREIAFFIAATLGLQLATQVKRSGTAGWVAQASYLALLCIIGLSVKHFVQFNALRAQFLAEPFPRTVQQLAAGQSWFALSTDVGPAFPTIVLTEGQWASRSPHQWLIPGIVRLGRGNERDREQAMQLRHLATGFVAQDMDRYRPVMVAVKTGGDQGIAGPFEFLPFFAEDERFRRAWTPYRLERSIEGWQFYVRNAPAGAR